MIEQEEDILTIDFQALRKVLWKEKFWIFGLTAIITGCGIAFALWKKDEFVAQGKILPEIQAGVGSSLGGLANLVGIGGFELGLKNNTEAIRPDLYPDILASTPFFLSLMDKKFIRSSGDSVSFENYYHQDIEEEKKTKEEFLTTFSGKPEGVIILNRLSEERIKDLRERIQGSIDKKSGVISISAKLRDPVLAAQVAKYGMQYLTEYVTSYRTEKLRQEVDFLGRKVAAAKGEFYKDQARKASYSDQFFGPSIRLQSADIQRERIESEYRMSSDIYNELLKKYEEAKIKLQQQTPVFQMMEPPVAPTKKAEPKRSLIVVAFAILGLFLSVVFVVLFRKNFKLIFK